jgi:hypothetical protein
LTCSRNPSYSGRAFVPLPAALPLFASGLLLVGWATKKRKTLTARLAAVVDRAEAVPRILRALVASCGREFTKPISQLAVRTMRKKYSESAPKEEIKPLLSDRDQSTLKRLVRDYGVEEIIAAAKAAPPPQPRGRPVNPRSRYKRIHEADWIEEVMEENRRCGSRAPLLEALLLLYEYIGGAEEKRDIQKFLSTSKRRFKQGRRELRECREAAQRWHTIKKNRSRS